MECRPSMEPVCDKRSSTLSRELVEAMRVEQEDARSRRKQLRQAEKMVQRLAKLGLDEHGDPLDNFSLLKYPVRECKFKVPGFQEAMAINPVVTLIAVAVLWSIVLTCICK
jgi:hypothetical protein